MPMSLYRSIIRQSFIIAWKHKYLWFFGLFATFLASNFEIELVDRFLNRQSSTIYDRQRWADTGVFSLRAWGNLMTMIKTDTWSFISILVVFLVLIILLLALLWLAVVSQGALVNNSEKALAEGARKISVAERKHDTSIGFREGRKKFWPILGVNFFVRLIVYVLALVTIAPIAITSSVSVVMSLVYFVVFIVLLALALILAFITKYAIAYIVLKDKAFGQAIMSAWKLFKNNWLVSLEMTFILFAISILYSLALIVAVLVVAIPIAILYVLSLLISSFTLFLIAFIIGIIIVIAIIVIGGSVLTVIQTTAWVDLFSQLTSGKGPDSKLERIFNDVV